MNEPLAAFMRPATLADYVGQHHLVGEGQIFRRLLERDNVPSMILWGPPGVGKTTLAQIIAHHTASEFVKFSAVSGGIKEVREVMASAENAKVWGKRTIVFVDEIHRFNKAQQDAFLPYVENGSITLVGATTENPSFEIISALLSRCKVFLLYALTPEDLQPLLRKAADAYGASFGLSVDIPTEHLSVIADHANGDARVALNTLEMILGSAPTDNAEIHITTALVQQCLTKKFALYDKNGEEHYNLISALHKSMRNSDVHASIYWLTRMLDGGEDPLYIARRVVRFAGEDIGMADSNALLLAVTVYQACHFLGMPECGVHLTHAVTHCALAPKSNALDAAYLAALHDAREAPAAPVPLAIRNAPTALMKELNYGKDYRYAHDYENKITDMQCLPDNLVGKTYYNPTDQGKEAGVQAAMQAIEARRKARHP